jgi:WD40 repeat protein
VKRDFVHSKKVGAHLRRKPRNFGSTLASAVAAAFIASVAGAQDAPAPSGEAAKDDGPVPVAELKHEGPVDFEREVLPLFQRSCLACHNRTDHKAGLVLETPQTIAEGGRHGAAVVPGKSTESLLMASAARKEKPFMPPKNNKASAPALTSQELGLVKLWIDEGAKGTVSRSGSQVAWSAVAKRVRPIYSAAITEDARLIACSRGNHLYVYNLPAGRLQAVLKDPALPQSPDIVDPDSVQSIAFAPQGGLLASGGYRTVKIWKTSEGAPGPRIEGLGAPVSAVAASADGGKAALGTTDGRVIFWSFADGKASRPLAAHGAAVTGVVFSADGARLFSSSQDGSVAAWIVETGFPDARFGAGSAVHGIAVVAKESRVAAACADGTVKVWALPPAAGAPAPVVLQGHSKAVTAIAALASQENQIATGSEDGTVRVWDVLAPKEIRQMSHGAPVTSVAARPDGQAIASVGADKRVVLWNAADGKSLAEIKGDPSTAQVADWRKRKSEYLKGIAGNLKNAVAAADNKVKEEQKKVADAKAALEKLVADQSAAQTALASKSPTDKAKAEAEMAAAKKQAEESIANVGLSQKEAETAAAKAKSDFESAESATKTADAALEAAQKAAAEIEVTYRAAVFSPDGSELATARDDKSVLTWSGKTGELLEAQRNLGAQVAALAFVPGRGILEVSAAGEATVWNDSPDPSAAAWPLVRTLGALEDPATFSNRVTALDFSADGSLLAAGGGEPSRSGELRVFKVADGSLVQGFSSPHSDVILAVEISPDGTLVASGSADKFVKVFEIATGKLVRSFEGHTHHVLGVSWRSDGRILASAGADSVVKVWNLESGEQVRTIEGFGKQVTAVRFVDFTSNIVTSCGDRNVRLHNTDNGQGVRTFGGGAEYLYTADITPDGRRVIAGGFSGVLQVWDGTNGTALASFQDAEEPKN